MACEATTFLYGCALLLDVSGYRAHASRGLARTPSAVSAASEASRHSLTGAATPPRGGGECRAHGSSSKARKYNLVVQDAAIINNMTRRVCSILVCLAAAVALWGAQGT